MILVCYDGSADAQSAIDQAAQLMPGAAATVLSVWEPYVDAITRSGAIGLGFGVVGSVEDTDEMDAASREAAQDVAQEGADRASAAGLAAQPRIATRVAGIAFAILREAAEVGADVIVLGTRGRGGVKSYLLGSVSHEVTQHADRAVLVVPSGELAAERRTWTRHAVDPGGVT
jgi:nucleotide-binding universal stress UspA family protein